MGQAAKSEISIYLKEDIELPLELTSATAIHKAMLKHYYKTNPEAVGEPHINIVDYENHENAQIDVELYSTRRVNLDFQVDLLQDYLIEHEDVIEEVTEDTWVQA